jgi:hypothetical protein
VIIDPVDQSLQIDSIGTNIKIMDFYIGAMKTPMSTWRPNYKNLLDPSQVAKFMCDMISYNSINPTEFTIRRVG